MDCVIRGHCGQCRVPPTVELQKKLNERLMVKSENLMKEDIENEGGGCNLKVSLVSEEEFFFRTFFYNFILFLCKYFQ